MDEEPERPSSRQERLRRALPEYRRGPDADADLPAHEHEAAGDAAPETGGFLNVERLQTALTDPVYGYMIVMALSLGLTPLAPDVRYMILWTLIFAMGALVFLLGPDDHRADATPANLVWGAGFGLLIGVPALALVAPALALTSAQLFPAMSDMSVYMALVFAMPPGETLFFRGALQGSRGFRAAALAAGGWSVLLFAPNLGTLTEVVVVGIAVIALGFAYAYVRQRNGLAAAWLCQVITSALLLFAPRLG
ncbi:MAG: hypothetical protein JXB47_15375 [Anaerolineae bacterium]|nr:hypothetical protein [Anaerolineae bacterium]